ncbi:MAG: hypothetical protein AAFX53_01310, partial [Bacteroidota bacterium]
FWPEEIEMYFRNQKRPPPPPLILKRERVEYFHIETKHIEVFKKSDIRLLDEIDPTKEHLVSISSNLDFETYYLLKSKVDTLRKQFKHMKLKTEIK